MNIIKRFHDDRTEACGVLLIEKNTITIQVEDYHNSLFITEEFLREDMIAFLKDCLKSCGETDID